MIEFEWWAALVAGFTATVVMSMLMNVARAAGMTAMPSIAVMMGSMVSGERQRATAIGVVIHYGVMGTVVFGLLYAWLFTLFDSDTWWMGALIGLVHGAAVGLTAMPMMPAMHPRMDQPRDRELVAVGAPGASAVSTDQSGELHVEAPGLMGARWGAMTPVGLVMGHAIYGVVLALVYSWLF